MNKKIISFYVDLSECHIRDLELNAGQGGATWMAVSVTMVVVVVTVV